MKSPHYQASEMAISIVAAITGSVVIFCLCCHHAAGTLNKARLQEKAQASIEAFAAICGTNPVRLQCDQSKPDEKNKWFLCWSNNVGQGKVKFRDAFVEEACMEQAVKDNCPAYVNGVLDDQSKLGFYNDELKKCAPDKSGYSFNKNVNEMEIKSDNDHAKQFAGKFA